MPCTCKALALTSHLGHHNSRGRGSQSFCRHYQCLGENTIAALCSEILRSSSMILCRPKICGSVDLLSQKLFWFRWRINMKGILLSSIELLIFKARVESVISLSFWGRSTFFWSGVIENFAKAAGLCPLLHSLQKSNRCLWKIGLFQTTAGGPLSWCFLTLLGIFWISSSLDWQSIRYLMVKERIFNFSVTLFPAFTHNVHHVRSL